MIVNSVMAGTDSLVRSSSSRSLRRIVTAARITGRAPRPSADGAAAPQAQHHVGLGQRAGDVVADQHARAARGAPDQRLEQLGGGRVEVGARLVEQQQRRLVQHGPGDGDALDHAARELADRVVGAALHADLLEHGRHARLGHAVQARRGSAGSRGRSGRGRAAARDRGSRPGRAASSARSGRSASSTRARRRAGAAARRARAAAWSCRRRCRPAPRASARPRRAR